MSIPLERTHRIASDVFLSYAREDLAQARRLAEQVEAWGYTVAMDVNDVSTGEDWQARLDQLLRSAAKFMFLATPTSVVSPACARELELARQEGKAILTVVLGDLPRHALPEMQRNLHYNRLPHEGDWADRLSALAGAIASDLDWERKKAAYLSRAIDHGGLLYGRTEVQKAEGWALARPANAAPIPVPVAQMIQESRARLTRMTRFAILGFAALSVVIAGLAVQAHQRSRLAETRNGVLMATEAERLAGELRTDAALLVLLQSAELVAGTGVESIETKRVEAAAARILDRAEREKRYKIPGDSALFEHANALYYISPTTAGLWWLNPDTGPSPVAEWPGRLIGSANQYGKGNLPVMLALQVDSKVTVFETDPATGQRGREVTIETVGIVPETAVATMGPDGRGIVSGETAETDADGSSITKSWAFDLTAGSVLPVPPDLPESLVLFVDDLGQSLIGEMWNAEALWDFSFDRFALEDYSFDALRYNDCLQKGGFSGAEAINMAANMAAMAAPEDTFDVTSEELALSNVHQANCVFSQSHASFSNFQSTSAGGVIITSLWDRGDWLKQSTLLWMTETFGLQIRPSLYSSGPSTTLAIADMSDVVVMQITDSVEDYTGKEMRLKFLHNVEHAVAIGPDRIIAVEGFPWNGTEPSRRVTVLSLAYSESDPMEDANATFANPAWPDVCLSNDAYTQHQDVRWIARDRVEVSPDRHPDHILTLPVDLADFVHDDASVDSAELATEKQSICLSFTPDGNAFMVETETGIAVHQTADGAHLVDLPDLGDYEAIALRKGYREALIAVRRTVERIWQEADGTWQRAPVLFTPYSVADLFLASNDDILIVTYYRGGGRVEASAISLSDYRELKAFGSAYKYITPEWETDGSVSLPELGAAFQPITFQNARDRLAAALSADCRPSGTEWQLSHCWPFELR